MTDRNNVIGQGAFEPDPARDVELGSLLREHEGLVPMHAVNWEQLASRISARVQAHVAQPWWSYAARWERRMVPIALAAGIAAAMALVSLEEATPTAFLSAASVSNAVVAGAPVEDAVSQFAHSVTSIADISSFVLE